MYMHSFCSSRRFLRSSRSPFSFRSSAIARSYASGVSHTHEPSFSVWRYSTAWAELAAMASATITTRIAFMLFPVGSFDGERLQIRPDLGDLGVVQDLLPGRHLLLGPTVLHDDDEFAIAAPEHSEVPGVLAES